MDRVDDGRRHGRARSRSRSPRRHREEKTTRRSPVDDSRRRRRRSPEESDRHHHHRRHHRHRSGRDVAAPASLPYEARTLSKADLEVFRPLLAYYLDLQKQKDICDMDEREVRGRWKSFVGKWNRGELSMGWYDPEMFMTAKERAAEIGVNGPRQGSGSEERQEEKDEKGVDEDYDDDEDDDDDDLGPSLPPLARNGGQRVGPGIPNVADLSLRRENLAEEAQRDREARIEDLRQQRKDDRKLQRERLDDVAPRPEAGTRERMLEKKALVNEKMKGFREQGDGQVEVTESELMGGGDSLAELRAAKTREERKKTEREIRREEIARARAEEREERVREYREREDKVMKGLKELAKQRFG